MMRRILAAVTAAVMIGGAALAESVPGNRLGLEVLARIADGTQNQFVSPVSLGYALSMAAAGAEGDTLAALLRALGAEEVGSISALNAPLAEASLKLAGAAFVKPGVSVKADYQAALEDQFVAACVPLEDATQVNAWISEHTDGLIGDALNASDLPPDLNLMLVNAIAMDAEWASPFEAEDTWAEDFHAPDGDVRVDFMHQSTYAKYGESGSTQFIRKGYAGGRLAMLIALPAEGKLTSALAALKKNGLDYFQFKPMPQAVALSMPKLDISVNNSLTEALKESGLKKPLGESAEFPGICDEPLMISDVLQQVRVQVDEEGTRAAAATEIMMAEGAAPDDGPQPVQVRVDRPFVLVIVDEPTGAICFAGAVVRP